MSLRTHVRSNPLWLVMSERSLDNTHFGVSYVQPWSLWWTGLLPSLREPLCPAPGLMGLISDEEISGALISRELSFVVRIFVAWTCGSPTCVERIYGASSLLTLDSKAPPGIGQHDGQKDLRPDIAWIGDLVRTRDISLHTRASGQLRVVRVSEAFVDHL
jgi:hypothetical protein